MNGNSWPIDAPSPVDNPFWCLAMNKHDIQFRGKTVTEDQASAEFQHRFGYPPEWIVTGYCGMAWFGPIVREDETNTAGLAEDRK